MSPFLAFGVGVVIAFLATRAARRSARTTQRRLLAAHAAHHDGGNASARSPRGAAEAYLAEAQASLDAELRRVRDEPARPLYTPDQARAAKAAMAPTFGVRMRVKP